MNDIAAPYEPQDLSEVVAKALDINVFRTGNLAVLIQVHDLAVPAPKFQFLAQPHHAHGPAAYGRRPVSDLQNPLQIIILRLEPTRSRGQHLWSPAFLNQQAAVESLVTVSSIRDPVFRADSLPSTSTATLS